MSKFINTMKPIYARWWYTLLLFICYFSAFQFWGRFSSRNESLVIGCGFALVLLFFCQVAIKKHYFVDKRDRNHHLYVIVDLVLEGALYYLGDIAIAMGLFQPGTIFFFHEGESYGYCVLVFTLVLGGYRKWRLSTGKI